MHLLAFDDRSAEMAEAQGIPVVNMYRTGLQGGAPIEEEHAFAARIAGYGLDGTNFLFSHERVTFGIRDTAALRRRFMIYTNAMEAVLDRLTAGGKRVIAVQELGGFLSVIACFYAAKEARRPELVHRAVILSRQALLYPGQFQRSRHDAGAGGRGFDRCASLSR